MERWEYMTVTLNFDPEEEQWNMSGWDEQGWEAVNLVPVSTRLYSADVGPAYGLYADVYRVLFKRHRPWA